MRISDWSSDVCSSDLFGGRVEIDRKLHILRRLGRAAGRGQAQAGERARAGRDDVARAVDRIDLDVAALAVDHVAVGIDKEAAVAGVVYLRAADARLDRAEAVSGDRKSTRPNSS